LIPGYNLLALSALWCAFPIRYVSLQSPGSRIGARKIKLGDSSLRAPKVRNMTAWGVSPR
ncbi:MAG: hypothetical protein WB586_07150, partial [Chthoniobacterales bacterium]